MRRWRRPGRRHHAAAPRTPTLGAHPVGAPDHRPAWPGPALWYVLLLVLPLVIVILFSFGERAENGGYDGGFTLDNFASPGRSRDPFRTSLVLADRPAPSCACSSACRSPTTSRRAPASRKSLLIILLVIPFWTSFLIRTYAWLIILGPTGRGRVHRRHHRRPELSGSSARRSRSCSASSTATCR